MSGRDEPDAVLGDDRLLDALGQGGGPPSRDDVVAHLLAAWRERLPGTGASGGGQEWWSLCRPTDRVRRPRRLAVAVSTAMVLLGTTGGVCAAAAGAHPGSPLWPVTELVFAGRADTRRAEHDAERAIRDARAAAAEGRYRDAVEHLDRAAALLDAGGVDAPALHAEIEAIRQALPVLPPTAPAPERDRSGWPEPARTAPAGPEPVGPGAGGHDAGGGDVGGRDAGGNDLGGREVGGADVDRPAGSDVAGSGMTGSDPGSGRPASGPAGSGVAEDVSGSSGRRRRPDQPPAEAPDGS